MPEITNNVLEKCVYGTATLLINPIITDKIMLDNVLEKFDGGTVLTPLPSIIPTINILPQKTNNCTPPIILERNSYGLLTNINYIFDPITGLVDYRKLIKLEHLVPNRSNFKKRGQSIPESIEGLEDKDLLVLLIGMKELCNIRGYNYVKYIPVTSIPGHCCFICEIEFIGNYETFGQPIKFQAIADASFDNTESFAKNYLSSICENRAFVRCVRNALRINIVGRDEIGKDFKEESSEPVSNSINPTAILDSLLKEKNKTFEDLKSKFKLDYNTINDIPKSKILELIDKIKNTKVKQN